MSKDYDKGADGQRRPNRDGKPLVKLLLDCGILREGMRVLEDLWRHLLGKAMPPNQWDITLAFNLLRSMGYALSISFHDIAWKHCQPVSEATAFFTQLLHPWLDNPPETVHEKITAFLEERAEDGTVCRRTTGQIGTMTWRRDEI